MYGTDLTSLPAMDFTNLRALPLAFLLLVTLPTATSGGWVKRYRPRPKTTSNNYPNGNYGDSTSFTNTFDDFDSHFKSGGYDLADLKFGSDFRQDMSYDQALLGSSSYGFGDNKYGKGFGKSLNLNYSPGSNHYDMGQGYGPESSHGGYGQGTGYGQSYGSPSDSYGTTGTGYGTGYGQVGGSAQQPSIGQGSGRKAGGGESGTVAPGSGKSFDQGHYKSNQGYTGEGPSYSSRSSAPLSSSYKHYVPQQATSFDNYGSYAGNSQASEPFF